MPTARRPRHPFVPLVIGLSTILASGTLLFAAWTVHASDAQHQQWIAALETATHLAVEIDIDTPTPIARHTLPPIWTATDTPTASDTFTPSATDTQTASATATPTVTPTATATATDTLTASLTASLTPSQVLSVTPTFHPPANAPTPVSALSAGSYDIFNILLVGSDKRATDPSYRTDTLIIVSINRTTRTMALLSIPRDLYVYIPRYGYDRINTAAERGDWMNWPGGGIDLLINTIGYNLGIPIQRYAMVDFDNFQEIINHIGGIDVAVDCPISDFRIASPLLKVGVESNYAWYTLPIGIHHMDGAEALWYARSRETTSDFDRSRRQQVVLRAIWHQAEANNLIAQLPDLWTQLTQWVDTNLNLGDVLSLLPLATDLDASRLRSYALGPAQTTAWTTPDGSDVLLPRLDAIRTQLALFYTPPTDKHLFAEQPIVEIFNGTTHKDWDQLAAARLAWEGFQPLDKGALPDDATQKHMQITDYTGTAKPESLKALSRIFRVPRADVIDAPDPNRTADFRVVIGSDYNACTFDPWQSPIQAN